jgi:hypothetical protein
VVSSDMGQQDSTTQQLYNPTMDVERPSARLLRCSEEVRDSAGRRGCGDGSRDDTLPPGVGEDALWLLLLLLERESDGGLAGGLCPELERDMGGTEPPVPVRLPPAAPAPPAPAALAAPAVPAAAEDSPRAGLGLRPKEEDLFSVGTSGPDCTAGPGRGCARDRDMAPRAPAPPPAVATADAPLTPLAPPPPPPLPPPPALRCAGGLSDRFPPCIPGTGAGTGAGAVDIRSVVIRGARLSRSIGTSDIGRVASAPPPSRYSC